MHRETNLQVENEETIEAQSARTLRRCWTESNSAFSFGARISFDGAGEPRCVPRARVVPRVARASSRPPDFVHVCRSIAAGAQPRACRPGLPGWRAQKASVTLSFRRPCGRENGRQFSYKQNAEEGVRLDEKRGTTDRGTRGGWRRPFGGAGRGMPRLARAALRPACAFRCIVPARWPVRSLRSHPMHRSHSHERPWFRSCLVHAWRRIRPGRPTFRRSLRPHRSCLAQHRLSPFPSS